MTDYAPDEVIDAEGGSWNRLDTLFDWPGPAQEGGSWNRLDTLMSWPPPAQEGGSWNRLDTLFDWPGGIYRDGRVHLS